MRNCATAGTGGQRPEPAGGGAPGFGPGTRPGPRRGSGDRAAGGDPQFAGAFAKCASPGESAK